MVLCESYVKLFFFFRPFLRRQLRENQAKSAKTVFVVKVLRSRFSGEPSQNRFSSKLVEDTSRGVLGRLRSHSVMSKIARREDVCTFTAYFTFIYEKQK